VKAEGIGGEREGDFTDKLYCCVGIRVGGLLRGTFSSIPRNLTETRWNRNRFKRGLVLEPCGTGLGRATLGIGWKPTSQVWH
jgi:hypothetical protein